MIFLGTIANVGTDVLNNTNTAVPFTIPAGITQLILQPSAATMMAAVSANNSSFAPPATSMLQLGAAQSIQSIPIQWALTTTGYETNVGAAAGITLAVRKTDAGAGITKVFGL